MNATQKFSLVLLAAAALLGWLPPEAALLGAAMLNTAAPSSEGAAASPSAGASDGSTPGTGAPSAGGGSPADGAAPAPASKKELPQSRGARAAERAAARLAAKPNTPTATDGQQAPAGNLAGGASTEQPGTAGPTSADTRPADGEGGKAAAPASTELTAPQDWPKDRQEAFNKLAPEARANELAFHKEMHSAFTRTMTQLAEQSKTHQEAITIGQQFQADPKAAITELAKRAGLEIFFERPGPEDVPPDDVLNNPTKYAKWVADAAVREATRTMEQKAATERAEAEKKAEATAVAEAGQALQQELAAAEKAYPDFGQHKPQVMALLRRTQGGLSTEEAYRLTTYDAMVKRVNEGETAKRELATLKAEAERKAKDATRLPAGAVASGAARGEDKFLSLGARAANRAEARIKTRTAAG